MAPIHAPQGFFLIPPLLFAVSLFTLVRFPFSGGERIYTDDGKCIPGVTFGLFYSTCHPEHYGPTPYLTWIYSRMWREPIRNSCCRDIMWAVAAT